MPKQITKDIFQKFHGMSWEEAEREKQRKKLGIRKRKINGFPPRTRSGSPTTTASGKSGVWINNPKTGENKFKATNNNNRRKAAVILTSKQKHENVLALKAAHNFSQPPLKIIKKQKIDGGRKTKRKDRKRKTKGRRRRKRKTKKRKRGKSPRRRR